MTQCQGFRWSEIESNGLHREPDGFVGDCRSLIVALECFGKVGNVSEGSLAATPFLSGSQSHQTQQLAKCQKSLGIADYFQAGGRFCKSSNKKMPGIGESMQ